MKRVLFNNIQYKIGDDFFIMNLYSFRRHRLSEVESNLLQLIDNKIEQEITLNYEEQLLLKDLENKKQILDQKTISNFDLLVNSSIKVNDQMNINNITINITYECNYNCVYCYQKKYENRKDTLSISDINNIYTLLDTHFSKYNLDFKLDHITISGGEPLLKNQIKILNHILEKFKNTTNNFSLFTNGVNIIKYRKDIDFSKFSEFQISIDGYNNIISTINNNNTSPFDSIIKGIDYINQWTPEIRIITMMSNETIESFDYLLEKLNIFSLFDHDNITFKLSTIINTTSDKSIDHDFYDYREYLALREKIKPTLKGTKYQFDSIYDLSSLSFKILRKVNDRSVNKTSKCNTAEVIPLLFGANGKIYWCTCNDLSNGIIGEFRKNITLNYLEINKYLKRNVFSIDECKKCDFKYVCSSGCPISIINSKGNVLVPNCGVFKEKFVMDNIERFIF